MEVSVIVPVFNAEKTIVRCVRSILLQTFRDFELILVNDASTDGTADILTQLERLDPERILVIHSDRNRGAGGARNIALEYAKGEYLSFVDSDDYIASFFLEKLVEEAKKGDYDVVDTGYYDEAKERAILHTPPEKCGKLDDFVRDQLIAGGGYLVTKLIRRTCWEEWAIHFRENCILEDSEVLVSILARAETVGAVSETMYWYTATAGSSSKQKDPVRYIRNIVASMSAIGELEYKLKNFEAIRNGIEYEILQMYNYGVVMILSDYQGNRILDGLRELQNLRSIRMKYVRKEYENPYVRDKIGEEDLKLMKMCDVSPEDLLYGIK